MQDLDPLGNTNEIYANLTVMNFQIISIFEYHKLNYV